LILLTLVACSPQVEPPAEVTVYSGRAKTLIEPLLTRFTAETGIRVKASYGDSAELAATILEEGRNSPADVFWAQDAGALGALAAEGKLAELEDGLLNRVDPRFRSPERLWVGTSGRARSSSTIRTGSNRKNFLNRSWTSWIRSGRGGWAGRRRTDRSRPSSRRCGFSWATPRRGSG
jgi:iron(III) transport system substrate-binding protein